MATPPRSCTRAGRSGCASCARSSTSSRATGTSGSEPTADRLGVLGGTFNPPHRGHVALARHAVGELGLDCVLLMPARASPGKPDAEDPGPAHRLEMCRLAAAAVEGLRACALEVERDSPSYTVDTLRALHAAHPDTALTFILGADVAASLPAWREAVELPALARFAVALRAGGSSIAEPAPDPVGFPITHLRMQMIDISSSSVRERVRRGLPVAALVGDAVAAYIDEHGLYRDREAGGRANGVRSGVARQDEPRVGGAAGTGEHNA